MSIAAFLAKHAKPKAAQVEAARVSAGGLNGVTFGTTEDGWILWIDDEGYSHISHPSYVRGVS